MRKVFLVNPSNVKDVKYKINGDTVTIFDKEKPIVYIIDDFVKNYYYYNKALPIFDKYIIEKPNSILMFDRDSFFKNLPCQTLGSLIKIGLIECKI